MDVDTLPRCPVCDEIGDCRRRLLEWFAWPGQRMRGGLWLFVDRMSEMMSRLVTECAIANKVPRHPGLQAAFDEACGIVQYMREQAAEEFNDSEDTDAWEKAYWEAELDRKEIEESVRGRVEAFLIEQVRAAQGVVSIVFEEPVATQTEKGDWVAIYAADPTAVRQHLLDLLAPLEVQLDQFYFERGESPPNRSV